MNNLVIASMHGMWIIVFERCKPIPKSNLTAWRLWYLFARARFCKWGLYGSFVVDYIGIGFKEKCDNNATVFSGPDKYLLNVNMNGDIILCDYFFRFVNLYPINKRISFKNIFRIILCSFEIDNGSYENTHRNIHLHCKM